MDYLSKYLFEASGRYDGGVLVFRVITVMASFHHLSVGWRISEEKFFLLCAHL